MTDRIVSLERAREALASESWSHAYELLHALDPSTLSGRDLEGLAEAAWWRSEIGEMVSTRQRAYAVYVADGEEPRAAYMAGRLCIDHFLRGEFSVASGWLRRAGSHLEGRDPCVEHAYLAMIESALAVHTGDTERALEQASAGREIARRFGDRDAWAMSVIHQGFATIATGSLDEGLGLLDEAMTAVVAGELTSFFTGSVYCMVIEACLEISDVRRAQEWSEAAAAWCRSIPPESPFPGLCRVNRAEVETLRGAWAEAEAEAERAADELARLDPAAVSTAFVRLGEVRLRRGDLAGAETAFARAHELGAEPQPGLALLRLAQGKAGAARSGLRLALFDETRPARRASLLAARVEADLVEGDVDAAADAAGELEALAPAFPSGALRALAETALGVVASARQDTARALERLRRACALWQELRLPYETARARVRYGLAVRATGDEDGGALELRTALGTFERLGAVRDAASTLELLGLDSELPRGLTARELEVLRLVAAGRTNRDIGVELVISEHTVARHLQNLYAKLDVSSRAAATAFAFEHGLA